MIDANIIIDLYIGDLLDSLFETPFRVLAPDSVVDELHNPDGRQVVENGLESQPLSGPQLLEVMTLRDVHLRLSTQDLQAFILARDLNATLLTGDGGLRELAENNNVAVHGTLWVLDEMVRLEVVSTSEAARSLRRMMAAERRLPVGECQSRLREWED